MDELRMIGHHRIVELLGSGAMGTVHVAVDTFIERAVAIKSLRAELTRDPDFVSRFRAEATSLARLNHPNITTLYSPILEGSDLYMVMRSLDDVLALGQKLWSIEAPAEKSMTAANPAFPTSTASSFARTSRRNIRKSWWRSSRPCWMPDNGSTRIRCAPLINWKNGPGSRRSALHLLLERRLSYARFP